MNKLPPFLRWSFYLFAIAAVTFLLTGVVLDSVLASVPQAVQRILIVVLIVLPAAVGAVLSFLSLFRQPRRLFLSILSLLVNSLTALFFAFLASFAG